MKEILLAVGIVVLLYVLHSSGKKKRYGNYRSVIPNPGTGLIGEGFETNRPAHSGYNGKKESFAAPESVDYQEQLKNMALEPTVKKSHRRHVNETRKRTATSSAWTERDDTNDINPTVGLTKPMYHKVWSGETSRVVSSEEPNQMKRMNHVRWGPV